MIKKYSTILLLFLICYPIFSQPGIIKKTYEIVDTSDNKLQQAETIYNWLTHNISYDTKQLTKRDKYYSPNQTLRRKKAICYGYSELFHKMCNILEIESYIINGYCKGFDYVENNHFNKGNHTWNIICIDSNWVVVDATWGSGELKYDYSLLTKIKQLLKENSGIKSKILFTHSPTDRYFNISPKNISLTHFPLDAKWQLSDYPTSYNSFIAGGYQKIGFLNYNKEISKIKYMGLSHQKFIDAINSIKYNPYNKFDIAYQYYDQASNLNINEKTPLDTILLKKLYISVSYYDSALYYLQEFKEISRKFYYSRKQNQRLSYRAGINSLKQIQRIPTTTNGRYQRKNKLLLRNENKLNKIANNIYPSGLLIQRDIMFSHEPVEFPDSSQIERYLENVDSKLDKIKENFVELNQYSKSIEQTFSSGYGQNDTLIDYIKSITSYKYELFKSIELMNEHEALKACNKLNYFTSKYASILDSKYEIEEKLDEHFDKMNNNYEITERTLNSILSSYDKLAKISGNNELYTKKANETRDTLFELYKFKMEMVKFLKIHNEGWKKLLTKQNQILTLNNRTGYFELSKKLELFYTFISNRNTLNYSNDMEIHDKLRTDSRKRIIMMRKTIKQIERTTLANKASATIRADEFLR